MDHIDGDRDSNRICCNLRLATRSEQAKNQNRPKTYKGKTVLKISLETGDVIEKYKSAVRAANDIGMKSIQRMSKICRKEHEYEGLLWRYEKKSDYGSIEWISSAKEYPKLPLFEGSMNDDIASLDGSISKGTKRSNGYMYTMIGGKFYKVSILICTLFHGPKPSDKHEVGHKNCKRNDNRSNNLEWVTRSENMKTTINNGMNSSCKPVRALYEDGTHEDFTSIAEAYRLTDAKNIGKVLRGKNMTSGRDQSGNSIRWEAILI
uniref:HNH endonuclease n=1 Tax=Pithovirus LCPAC401 TaxID=2506595 RepID=A0A481ZA18_9VIRU|nr:MAG: HNH endonuclease [Pithovirus LCPAC401]